MVTIARGTPPTTAGAKETRSAVRRSELRCYDAPPVGIRKVVYHLSCIVPPMFVAKRPPKNAGLRMKDARPPTFPNTLFYVLVFSFLTNEAAI